MYKDVPFCLISYNFPNLFTEVMRVRLGSVVAIHFARYNGCQHFTLHTTEW